MVINPAELSPTARAARLREALDSGRLNDLDDRATLRVLKDTLALTTTGKMLWSSPAELWQVIRKLTDLTLEKFRAFREFVTVVRLGREEVAISMAEEFGGPPDLWLGVDPHDVGRVAARFVLLGAPDLLSVVPSDLSREFTGGAPVGVEERPPPPPPPPPRIEFRPEAPVKAPGMAFRVGEVLPPTPPVVRTYATLEVLLRSAQQEQGASFYRSLDSNAVVLYRFDGESGQWSAIAIPHGATGYTTDWVWTVIQGEPPENALDIEAPPVIEVPERAPTQPKPPETVERQGKAEGGGGEVLPPVVPPPAPPPPVIAPPRVGKLQEGPQRRLMVEYEVPLTEKYRPTFLEDLVGNPAIVQQLQFIARTGNAPPCIVFVGPPGVGKTTAARALARTYFRDLAQREGVDEDLFGPQTFFEVGTEDIRIDPAQFVESRLVPFLRSMSMFGGRSRKWVLLDDVQKLSPQTQQSLLRPIERYSKVNTVIFAVNSARNLAPALRSRCEEGWFEFQPVEPKDVASRLRDISAQEGIALPNQEGAVDRIAKESKGDVRVALGLLAREWRAYQAQRTSGLS